MKYTSTVLILILLALGFSTNAQVVAKVDAGTKVKWYTWQEAVKMQAITPKPIMVDLYTDWCGWCKRMDATTFQNDTIADYLNANYYPVKFNAESKEEIVQGGQTLKFKDAGNGRGVHELAYALVDGKLGYPCFVYLNENLERAMISPGYKGPADVLKELRFISEGNYLTMKWEDYKAAN